MCVGEKGAGRTEVKGGERRLVLLFEYVVGLVANADNLLLVLCDL